MAIRQGSGHHLPLDVIQVELGYVPLEAVAVTATAFYSKSRVANHPAAAGGSAASRGAVVNSGGV